MASTTMLTVAPARAEYPVTIDPVASRARSTRFRTASIALLATGSAVTAGGVAMTVAASLQPFPRLVPCPPSAACGPAPTPVGPYLYIAGGLALGLGVGAVITGAVLYARGDSREPRAPVAFRSVGFAPSADGFAASALFTF